MSELADRINALDGELFARIDPPTAWDRRSLLALHAAVAERQPSFGYLEIGSFRGGSLQVLMRDPRCARAISIDPRTAITPDDERGTCTYDDNTTERMISALAGLPGAAMDKLVTYDASPEALAVASLPQPLHLAFIDGEHTDRAALRDARFCAAALGGRGVIAFHDHQIVGGAIRAFLREAWPDVSHAIAFTGRVFAIELGDGRVLQAPVIERAIASRWHSVVWRLTSRPRSATALLAAWSAMPRVDSAAHAVRQRLSRA
ncbi:MAG: 1-O-methyltransferase [Solirubrobacteraceae bacterium]|jgi:hypothetical protein|nr:1-O-methyltransferase [Solirubrobacteraceae bacterium]